MDEYFPYINELAGDVIIYLNILLSPYFKIHCYSLKHLKQVHFERYKNIEFLMDDLAQVPSKIGVYLDPVNFQ